MNPLLKLALEIALNTVLRDALTERFGNSVPVRVAMAAATRVFQLIEEGKAGDMTTLKTLALHAVDQVVKEYQS